LRRHAFTPHGPGANRRVQAPTRPRQRPTLQGALSESQGRIGGPRHPLVSPATNGLFLRLTIGSEPLGIDSCAIESGNQFHERPWTSRQHGPRRSIRVRLGIVGVGLHVNLSADAADQAAGICQVHTQSFGSVFMRSCIVPYLCFRLFSRTQHLGFIPEYHCNGLETSVRGRVTHVCRRGSRTTRLGTAAPPSATSISSKPTCIPGF